MNCGEVGTVLVSETSEIDYISVWVVEAHICGSPRALGGFLDNIHTESQQLLIFGIDIIYCKRQADILIIIALFGTVVVNRKPSPFG